MKRQSSPLLEAAVSGLLSASVLISSSSFAAETAKDSAKETAKDPSGKCWGANSCKGKSQCVVTGQNYCMSMNECKGKGWLESTKSKCEAKIKKNKKLRFEPDPA